MNKKIGFRNIALCCGIMIVMLYFVGVLIFYNHFAFRMYVNGRSVTLATEDDVILDVLREKNAQNVTLLCRGGSDEVVPFSQLGIYYIANNDVKIDKSKAFLWFTSFFSDTNYVLDTSLNYDYDAMVSCIKSLDCVSSDCVLQSSDNYVSLQENGSCTIVTEFDSTEIDIDRLTKVICESVQNDEFVIDLEEKGCYVEDVIRKQSLDYKLSDYSYSDVVLNLTDGLKITVPRNVIESSIYLENGQQYVRYPLIYEYVQTLANQYDTVGSVRNFTTSDGVDIELVPKKSDNFLGWKMNVVATSIAICEALVSDSVSNIDVIWSSKGAGFDDDNDFGDTYIELSIDKQHMWVYKDGDLLLDTDVTTGKDVDGMRTPTGLYHTLDWNTEYTMYGSYGSAFSHYFIRVTTAGVGIHDSSWRSAYGSDYYKKDGSHGCINMPYDKVDLLYKSLLSYSSGMIPVIIY